MKSAGVVFGWNENLWAHSREDTHLRHQESTLDLLAKRHGQVPQDESVVANDGSNLAKELVEVLFVLFKTPQAVPEIN